MELRDPLGRAINRESNTNNVGLRIPLIDSPEVKSAAAIQMNRVANSPVGRALGPIVTPNTSVPLAVRTGANAIDPKTGKPVTGAK